MIPIYKPFLNGNEKKYVNDCLDSTLISSQGKYISFSKNYWFLKHVKEFKKIVHVIEVKNMNIEQINNQVKLLFKKHE